MKKTQLLQHWRDLFKGDTSFAALATFGTPAADALLRGLHERLSRQAHLDLRLQLGRILGNTRKNRNQKREECLDLIYESMSLVSGWVELLARADARRPVVEPTCSYHLDREPVWWTNTSGDTFEVRRLRQELEGSFRGERLRAELMSRGFFELEQEVYRQRISVDVMHELLTQDTAELSWLVQMTLSLTGKGYQPFDDEGRWLVPEDEVVSTVSHLIRRWFEGTRPSLVALPHKPLATLPRESGNLGLMAEQNPQDDTGMKFHEEPGGQLSLLVYDQKLILKDNEVGDTFIRIPVSKRDAGAVDEVTALLQSLQGLEDLNVRQRRQFMTDLPRVVAGMFLAATQDAQRADVLGINHGEFLECDGATRLTLLIGLERRTRYTRRVAAVRDWLSQIRFERQVKTFRDGRKITTTWSSPIVQRLDTDITIESELPNGLERVRTDINVWRLEPKLWQMRTPDSGAAGFMLIDSRAFGMSTESSEPFNLYWTIVQRAYNDALVGKVSEDGVYEPRAQTLYEWSGMTLKSDQNHPHRIRERMRAHLDLMVNHGLLCGWSCDFLERETDFRMEVFQNTRIRITLPAMLCQYLPRRALSS